MKQYQEVKDFTVDPPQPEGYLIDNMSIPVDPLNMDYRQMLAEVEAGEAMVIPALEPAPQEQPLTLEERVEALEALLNL